MVSSVVCFKSVHLLIFVILSISLIAYASIKFGKTIKEITQTALISTTYSPTENSSTNIKVEVPSRFNLNTIDIPERVYSDNFSRKVGFIYGSSGRFPLYERRDGRDYKYHVLDDSRNGIVIEIDTKNKRDQLGDGDSILVSELGENLSVKLYNHQDSIYSSRVF